jgi:membrane-bound serine protease (ClpP class)
MAEIIRLITRDLEKVYTVAYVDPEAMSAGALMSVACNEIVMSPGSRIGASMTIAIGPGGAADLPERVRGKMESADLAEARNLADRGGYDQDLIEGMITLERVIWLIRRRTGPQPRELQIVDAADWYGKVADVPPARQPVTQRAVPVDAEWEYVRTIAGPKKLVALTPDQAMAYGLATRELESMEALKRHFNITADPVVLTDNWSERLVGLLSSPGVMMLLVSVGLLALYVEFNTPGFGVPGAVAVICFAILLGSRYLAGLANVWEIALFILGVVLLLAEVFITPGFGVLGIAGIACCVVGLLAMAIANPPDKIPWPDTTLDWEMLRHTALALVGGVLLAAIAAAVVARYLPKIPVAGRLTLAPPRVAQAPPATEDAAIREVRPGQVGEVVQICRPVGKVRVGGQLVDAIADGAFLPAGTRVVVLHNEGNRVVVEAKA